jgi:CheY-like chemotaxis protein
LLQNKKTILLVDDITANLFALDVMLKPTGIKTVKATSGKAALQNLYTNNIDLILLDIKMPIMNGYETAIQIRREPEFCQIPIIFVSAIDEGSDIFLPEEGHGIIDYMYKPIKTESFKVILQKYL